MKDPNRKKSTAHPRQLNLLASRGIPKQTSYGIFQMFLLLFKKGLLCETAFVDQTSLKITRDPPASASGLKAYITTPGPKTCAYYH